MNALTQDCTNFDEEYICKEFETEYPSYLDENGFQTPPRDDELGNYKNSYQDMHYLVGYSQLKYSPDRKICAINIITKVNPKLGEEGSDYEILYYFDEKEQKSNSYTITSDESFPDGMKISVRVVDMEGKQLAKLELEDEYFLWDIPPVNIAQNYENGQKGAIIELFGWPYDDIAE